MSMTPAFKREVFDFLSAARDQELVGEFVTEPSKVIVASQKPEGRSFWAKMVREGHLKETHIYWALRRNGDRREWLAFLADSGNGKRHIFDLTSQKERDTLKALEEKFKRYLRAKERDADRNYLRAGSCPECGEVMQLDANFEPRCYRCS